MPFDPKAHLAELLQAALASVAPGHADNGIELERPKLASHGDFSSNLALKLAKTLAGNPRDIARRLVVELPNSSWVAAAEVAGAGFINFRLAAAAKRQVVPQVLAKGGLYGKSVAGHGRRVQVELSPPIPPGRCTSDTDVAPPTAPAWRPCWHLRP